VGDGSQKRDFVHVHDVANANVLAALTDIPDEYYGQVYNIGSGENISILEIAKIISDNYVHIPSRDGEAKTTLSCIDKSKNIFGWEPKFNVKDWIGENK